METTTRSLHHQLRNAGARESCHRCPTSLTYRLSRAGLFYRDRRHELRPYHPTQSERSSIPVQSGQQLFFSISSSGTSWSKIDSIAVSRPKLSTMVTMCDSMMLLRTRSFGTPKIASPPITEREPMVQGIEYGSPKLRGKYCASSRLCGIVTFDGPPDLPLYIMRSLSSFNEFVASDLFVTMIRNM